MQGLVVFVTGNLLQNQSHRILAALSAGKAGDQKADSYKIPYGMCSSGAATVCCCSGPCSAVRMQWPLACRWGVQMGIMSTLSWRDTDIHRHTAPGPRASAERMAHPCLGGKPPNPLLSSSGISGVECLVLAIDGIRFWRAE